MPGFSGQGKVSIARRMANGRPGIFRQFGNASVFKLSLSADTVERSESQTGSRLPLRRMTRTRSGKLQLVGDEYNRENFALATLGIASRVLAGNPVPGFPLPPDIVAGSQIILPAKNVSAVVIKDSTVGGGGAKTLDDDQYVVDPFSGTVTFADVTTGGPYVQPFKADYTPGAYDVVGAFKAAEAEYYIRLDGVNTDANNERGICDVFRLRLDPTKALDLINNDYLDWDLDCSVLADLDKETSDPDGQFFGWYTAAAA